MPWHRFRPISPSLTHPSRTIGQPKRYHRISYKSSGGVPDTTDIIVFFGRRRCPAASLKSGCRFDPAPSSVAVCRGNGDLAYIRSRLYRQMGGKCTMGRIALIQVSGELVF
jgi:hypothetical protein